MRQRFFLALSIALLLCVLLFFRNSIVSYLKTLFLPDSSGHFDWFALISTAVIAGALLVVCIIGLFLPSVCIPTNGTSKPVWITA